MKEMSFLLEIINSYRPEIVGAGLSVVVGLIYLLGQRFSDETGMRG